MLLLILLLTLSSCGAQAVASGIGLAEAFPYLSFTRPVDFQHAGDGTGRVFVVEQAGRILVFPNDPDVTEATVFLDIRSRVSDSGNEMGLLGLAFHPHYAENGLFYVDYTAHSPLRTVVVRYRANPADPDRAIQDSEQVILEVDQPYRNHNGGQVAFGPDGYLYVALGDGGSGGDPYGHGQDRTTLLGTILRLDVDRPSGGRAYGIPADNPFAGNTYGYREEIYAYGLRNPWRFSFDPHNGNLWTGDVGQGAREEVDIVTAGGNYGWKTMEGSGCYSPSTGCNTSGLTLPVAEYGRREGVSITGGPVYRGTRVPDLTGQYLYADYGSGRIWALPAGRPEGTTPTLLLDTRLSISSFGVDAAGEVYLCAFDGKIYRFTAVP